MSSAELTPALLHFLRLFQPSLAAFAYPAGYPATPSDLRGSGLCLYLYRLLHSLDAAHFDLSDVDESAGADNLQQLLVSCETYIEDSPGLGEEVDLSEVGAVRETGGGGVGGGGPQLSEEESVRLVEVVLLCAVGGGKREEVIERILGMSEREQELMMQAINDIRTRLHMPAQQLEASDTRGSLGSVDGTLSGVPASPAARLSASFGIRSPASTGSSSTTSSPAATPKQQTPSTSSAVDQQQLTKLQREVRELRRREAELDDSNQTLQAQLEQQRRQHDTALAAKDKEHNERVQRVQSSHTRDIKELEQRVGELSATVAKHQKQQLSVEKEKLSLASQLEAYRDKEREWQDGMQLAQAKAEQAMALEAKVARLQQRLVSAGEQRAEAEHTEEEAKGLVQRIAELEREVKEVAALRTAVQRLKATVVQREEEALEARLREEQLVGEVDDLKESVRERQRHSGEAEEEVRRLQAELKEREGRHERKEAVEDVSGFELIGTPTSAALRERIKRLEVDNEQLRLRGGGDVSGGADVLVESEVDIARRLAKANESKYVEAMRRVAQLERQARNTAVPLLSPSAQQSEIASLQAEIESLHTQLASSASSAHSSTAAPGSSERKLRKYAELYKHAQRKATALAAKEAELRGELDKGRERERLLRAVVAERDTEVEVREKVRVEEMNIGLRERRAMSAAFYGLGLEYATAIVTGRVAPAAGSGGSGGSGGRTGDSGVQGLGGRSWIAKQRARVLE